MSEEIKPATDESESVAHHRTCSARLEKVRLTLNPGYASIDERALEARLLLEAIEADKIGHGNTLVGMVLAACEEIMRLRQNAGSVAPPPEPR